MKKVNFILGTIFTIFAIFILLYSFKQNSPQVLPAETSVPTPTVSETSTPSSNLKLYPDPKLTPGDIFPDATKDQICVKGYTATVRNVTQATRLKVYEEYGVTYPQVSGAYEVDHFIPLELGGSNDIKNLWLQAAYPAPGFHEKDIVENYLHSEVCLGKEDLSKAQEEIKTDWYKVYQRIPNPENYKY